ncbi:MAG TPA: SAM-dependent methyltransferase [Kofleriaceae bacterium]|nr:SAM-dependent methyltransferase [Kofleriaceae bacterium]
MSEQPRDGDVLESGRRLSESSTWRLQREFFDRRGAKAWSENRVPSHVTSNAYIAEAYLQIALRFIQDCAASPPGSPMALDPKKPIHIVELGAGHGYFGYLFLCKLLEVASRLPFPMPPVRYVLTDFTESNLEAWRQHPRLKPYFEAGMLDLARFDAERDTELKLERAREVLAPGSAPNPIIVVANYVFDSLSHDVFRIQNGKLEEGLATLRLARPAKPGEKDVLEQVDVQYEYQPIADAAAYYAGEPIANRILAAYGGRLGDTAFTFPLGALRCLEHLGAIAGGRMLVLSADKGHARELDLLALGDPSLAHHNGCISMMVNFHALGEMVTGQGGFMLAQAHRNASLELCALAMCHGHPLPETRLAFAQAFEKVGPTDVFRLVEHLNLEKMDLDALLSVLRMASWDPVTFLALAKHLHRVAGEAYVEQASRMREALHKVWTLHFPLKDGKDVSFDLGYVYYAMRRYREAMSYYRHSLELYGPHPVTMFNMGLCEFQQGRLDEALALFDHALDRDPTYAPARDWRLRVLAEQDRLGVDGLPDPVPAAIQDRLSRPVASASGGIVAAQDRATPVVVGVADGSESGAAPRVS